MDITKPNILIADQDPRTIDLMARVVREVARVRSATNGIDALRLAREQTPDLMLLDAAMPGLSGFEVCEAMKSDDSLSHVPVVIVTSYREPDFEVSGFDLGAADFISKPIEPRLLLARVKAQLKVKAMEDELRRVSSTDRLTGVTNRRAFDLAFAREWQRGLRGGEPLSLLLVDVDHFERYNVRYGHPVGDVCLKLVASALAAACQRPADLVARYADARFAILLPQTPRLGAEHVANRVLDAIEAMDLPHAASPTSRHVTVSIGVGILDADSPEWEPATGDGPPMLLTLRSFPEDLVAAADHALQGAQLGGRAQARLTYLGATDREPGEIGLLRQASPAVRQR